MGLHIKQGIAKVSDKESQDLMLIGRDKIVSRRRLATSREEIG